MLSETTHNTFPVLNEDAECIGIITRNALITVIKNKLWGFQEKENPDGTKDRLHFGSKNYSSRDITSFDDDDFLDDFDDEG